MKQKILTFIGGGNMARSLIGGLINNGYPAAAIRVSDPNTEVLQSLNSHYPVKTFTDNQQAIANADVVILAVKPQQLQTVTKQLAGYWQAQQLLISVAAGIQLEAISAWLSMQEAAIVRVMPNTPSLVQAGASALYANAHVNQQQHELAESILRSVGLAVWVDTEQQMDAVTALSGSGPAYIFLVMEAMQSAAIELGLSEKTARLLTLETVFGAAKMALESSDHPAQLRERVTSPGGTTEQALNVFEEGDIKGLFNSALTAAANRSEELAKQLGKDYDG